MVRKAPTRSFQAPALSLAAAAAGDMSGFFFQRVAALPWRSMAREALSGTFLVAQVFCAVHVVEAHVCSVAFAEGPSMLPAINLAGDVVAVDKISVRRGKVAPGDVVLMLSPLDPRQPIIKRVLGMEGDSVTYLVDPANSDASKTVTVPQGHVWVQGDNIYASRDSRLFGPVPYGLITGKVSCRVWPPKGFGAIDSNKSQSLSQ